MILKARMKLLKLTAKVNAYFSGIFIQDCEDWRFQEIPKIQDFQAQKVHHEIDVLKNRKSCYFLMLFFIFQLSTVSKMALLPKRTSQAKSLAMTILKKKHPKRPKVIFQ